MIRMGQRNTGVNTGGLGGIGVSTSVIWACCVLIIPVNAQILFSEDFEAGSVFGPASGFSRSTLANVATAPSLSPVLHINQGGDYEYRYTEAGFSHMIALAPGVYDNTRIDGYVGLGVAGSIGSLSAGLILRANGPSDYYVAYVHASADDPQSALFQISRSENGILGLAGPHLPAVAIPNFDPLHEDYHIVFEANGNQLSASIARERLMNGQIEETLLGSISGTNNALSSGQAGLLAFARVNHNVFFDDVSVAVVPEPSVLDLLGFTGLFVLGLYRLRNVKARKVAMQSTMATHGVAKGFRCKLTPKTSLSDP